MKRTLLAILLMLALLLSPALAEEVPAGEFPLVTDGSKTLTLLVDQWATNMQDWETNATSKYVEEKTGVNLEFEVVPDLYATKNTVMFGMDYPDVIMGYAANGVVTPEEIMLYGEEGQFVALEDYIDKYAVNLKKIFEEFPGLRENITAPDGHIYGMPFVDVCYHITYGNKFWLNQTWLDNLGLEAPTTTEELKEVLIQFRDQDANGNGDPNDELPLSAVGLSGRTGLLPYLMSAFITDDGVNHFVEPFDGTVDVIYNKEAFREGLRYLNDLYNEKLIDSEFLTQDNALMKQKTQYVDGNMVGAFAAMGHFQYCDVAHPSYREYAALAPIAGPAGVQTTGKAMPYPAIEKSAWLVTDNCEDPALAVRVADLLYSEEASLMLTYGVEGIDWRKGEEGEVGIDGRPGEYARIADYQGIQNTRWITNSPYYFSYDLRMREVAPQDIYDAAGLEVLLYQATTEYEPYGTETQFPRDLYIQSEDAEELSSLSMTLKDYTENMWAQFITGDKSLDTDWDGYIKELENIGLTRYLEIYQNSYDAAYGA